MSHSPIEGTIIATTDKAVLLEQKDGEEIWLPRSVIEDGDAVEENDSDPNVEDWFIDAEKMPWVELVEICKEGL